MFDEEGSTGFLFILIRLIILISKYKNHLRILPLEQILEHENEINEPLLVMIDHIRDQLIVNLEAELVEDALVQKHPV